MLELLWQVRNRGLLTPLPPPGHDTSAYSVFHFTLGTGEDERDDEDEEEGEDEEEDNSVNEEGDDDEDCNESNNLLQQQECSRSSGEIL